MLHLNAAAGEFLVATHRMHFWQQMWFFTRPGADIKKRPLWMAEYFILATAEKEIPRIPFYLVARGKTPPCFLTCRTCLSVSSSRFLGADDWLCRLLLVLFLNECALNRNPAGLGNIIYVKYMACLVFVSVSFIVLHKLCTLFTMKYFLS